MKLFKRIKKKVKEQVPYVEPVKPKPRVLKTFKNLRIVLGSRTTNKTIGEGNEQRIVVDRYENHLIIEQKDTNAMEEPFYKLYKEDYRWLYENTSYIQKPYGYDSDKLLFQLIEEMFLND
jgi:hypothetical protein